VKPLTISSLRTAALVVVLGAALLVAGCGSSNSPTTPTTPVAPPTIIENFNGTLPVGTFRFYSFSIVQNGTVNITLVGVSGNGVPESVTVALGLGHPAGTGCNATTINTTAQSTAPQITGTYDAGVWCVRIEDVGNLSSPATFMITIAHP